MRKLLALAPALLLVGCHSAQVVVQRPAPVAEPLAATAPVATVDSALTATVIARRPAALVAPGPLAATKPQNTTRAAPRPNRSLRPRSLVRLATRGITAPTANKLTQRIQHHHTTEGAAESGLGRVALFFIGVGLAVLAGLAALVNVIFSVGFFTALGYTAAGLVVLFLLYSLFSGGKKKK